MIDFRNDKHIKRKNNCINLKTNTELLSQAYCRYLNNLNGLTYFDNNFDFVLS